MENKSSRPINGRLSQEPTPLISMRKTPHRGPLLVLEETRGVLLSILELVSGLEGATLLGLIICNLNQ